MAGEADGRCQPEAVAGFCKASSGKEVCYGCERNGLRDGKQTCVIFGRGVFPGSCRFEFFHAARYSDGLGAVATSFLVGCELTYWPTVIVIS